jgi:hypothetical protein
LRLLNRTAEVIKRWTEDLGFQLDFVPGNHDQVDTAGRNALEVFEAFSNVRVWTEPGVLEEQRFGFIPYHKDPEVIRGWMDAVESESVQVVFAHFGVQGAKMNNSHTDSDGVKFRGYTSHPPYILGHYHARQAHPQGFMYVGSPYQTNFGEAGNSCGCLIYGEKFVPEFVPIEVGAPRHHVLTWDPTASDVPPEHPGAPTDKIRLDIKASSEMLIDGKFKGVLKKHGLENVQVNVIPVSVEREHRFEIQPSEGLLHAAERFCQERVGQDEPVEEMMGPLRVWAK